MWYIMFTINFEGFMELVNSLLGDPKSLESVYGAWATGQPIDLPYEVLKKYYMEYGNIKSSIDRFLRYLLKKKLSKIYFIVGEFGAGKTQLMFYLKGIIEEKFNIKALYFSLEDMVHDSERQIIVKIKEKVDETHGPVVIMIDDLDFYFTFVGNPVKGITNFLYVLYNAFKEKLGGKVRTIIVTLNTHYFTPLAKYLSSKESNSYTWKVLMDFNLGYEEFMELSLDIGFKLLALQYVLSYYDNFRLKIERNFDVIWEYLYYLTLRIAKFGIRTIGLYLKMVNDRLVDFIRFLDVNSSSTRKKDDIKSYVEVIDRYLDEKFNGIILTFDRVGGFTRYKIDYQRDRNGYMLGYLNILGLDDKIDGFEVKGRIGVYYTDSFRPMDSIRILGLAKKDNVDYYIVFQFLRKKRKIREEIEKVYLNIGDQMLRFSIVPLDINMLKFALYLKKEGYAVYMEKNTTSKKDLEEAVNILANNKILEIISSLPEERHNCEKLINALYLWSQTWILKSGLCRVRKRDLSIIRRFFNSLFPPKIYGLDSERILDEIINTLNSKKVLKIRRNKLIIDNDLDEDKILEEIIKVAKERFC